MIPKKLKLIWMPYLATPLRIKICEELQNYMAAKFLFFDEVGNRPTWWRYPLNPDSLILENVLFKKQSKYLTISHIRILNDFNPDVVVVPGFTNPTNFITYIWCKIRGKKIVVFTERLRDVNGKLRKLTGVWRIIRFFYRNIDLVMAAADDAVPQLRDEFKFGDKVVASTYGFMIDDYLDHKPRKLQKDVVKIIFPNRLTQIYNPIAAIDILAGLQNEYSNVVMSMNAEGELRKDCEQRILELNLQDRITFLGDIKGWEDLANIYAAHDIMILPANFSNGNFTIYEAMASGMGIIISDKVLGNGQEIENGVNGFNLELDVANFVLAIKKYINNPALLDQHVKINKERCKKYGVKETAKLYFEQLSSLFENK